MHPTPFHRLLGGLHQHSYSPIFFLVLLTGQKDQNPPAPMTQIHPNRRCGNLQIGAGCENPFGSGSVNPDDELRIPSFGILELSLSGLFTALNFSLSRFELVKISDFVTNSLSGELVRRSPDSDIRKFGRFVQGPLARNASQGRS